MRRPIRAKAPKANFAPTTMSRELDHLVDQWRNSRPEDRLQIVLAKIRAEEKAEAARAI